MATKKMARVKLPALPVPQSREEADRLIEKVGQLQHRRYAVQGFLDQRVATLKAEAEEKAKPWNEEIASCMAAIQAYCEAHRPQLTDEGRTKTVRFGSGEVSWRQRPPSVSFGKTKAEKVLETIKGLGRRFSAFVRVREEIDKEAMLADPKLAMEIPGVRVGSKGEDFIVKPISMQLEEIVR
jgi:phage host-nuclease inhibitor protein Gam